MPGKDGIPGKNGSNGSPGRDGLDLARDKKWDYT